MAVKYYCDKCEKEIHPADMHYQLRIEPSKPPDSMGDQSSLMDGMIFCFGCLGKIAKFIKEVC